MNFTKIEKCMEVNAQNIDVIMRIIMKLKKGKLKSCFFIFLHYILLYNYISTYIFKNNS